MLRSLLVLLVLAFVCIADNGMLVSITLNKGVNIHSLESQYVLDVWEQTGVNQFTVRISEVTFQQIRKSGDIIHNEILAFPGELDIIIQQNLQENSIIPPWTSNQSADAFFDAFRPYTEIDLFCDSLVARFPEFFTKFQAGVTWEGNIIYGYLLRTNTIEKPALWFQALQHAREWLATPTLLYTVTSLLEGYNTNSTITELVDAFDWYFVPVVNIDGYLYTWIDSSTRLWRKNRHDFGINVGVDLNRNWGPNTTWCTTGSSSLKASDTYCGEYVFSEPESRSMAEYIATVPSLVGGMDIHTYGSLLLWPWQYTLDKLPVGPYVEFSTLGQQIVDTVNAVNGASFVSQQGSDLYEHSGGFVDYNYEEHGMLTFTFELIGDSFVVPPSTILPSGKEIFAGILTFAQHFVDIN